MNLDSYINKITYADCKDIMRLMPDKYIGLAIVDPPYGIGETWCKNVHSDHYLQRKSYLNRDIPDQEYFNELFRVSKNQIIWGCNYYTKYLTLTNNLICWDKSCTFEKEHKSEFELAWTSITKYPAVFARIPWSGGRKGPETGIKTIHPHQKPIKLYRWLLQKYALPGDLILDTHSGSGTLPIACHLEGFNFIATEKDFTYYSKSKERYEIETSQLKLSGVSI